MDSALQRARHYCDRAEELRAKAAEFSPENRAMLLGIADDYDEFARQAERLVDGTERSEQPK